MKKHYSLKEVLSHLEREGGDEELVQLLRDIQEFKVPVETVDQKGFEIEGVFDHPDLEEVVKNKRDWYSFEEYVEGKPRKKRRLHIFKEIKGGEWEDEEYRCTARFDKCIMSMANIVRLKKSLLTYHKREEAKLIDIDKLINGCDLSETQRKAVKWLFEQYLNNPDKAFNSEEIFGAINYSGHEMQMSSLFKKGTNEKIRRHLKKNKGYWRFRVFDDDGLSS